MRSDAHAVPKRLVFIGDSLTQWFDWQRRFPDAEVLNLGISGENVEGLLARRDQIHSLVSDPDFIFLMTGINNLANGRADIMTSYREVVRYFTTWYKRTRLVIQSILPADLAGVMNDVIVDINRHLAQTAREYGAEYLDVYTVFTDSRGGVKREYLSDDGVHLSNRGYTAWADAVDRCIGHVGRL